MEKTDQYTKKKLCESKLQDQYNLSDLVFLLETGLTPREITKYGERRVRKFLDKITNGSPFIDDNTGREVLLPQSKNEELVWWLEACLKAIQGGLPFPKVPQGLKAVLEDGTRLALGKIKKTKEFGGGIKGEVKTRIVEEGVVRELEKLLGKKKVTYLEPESQEGVDILVDFKVKDTADAIYDYFTGPGSEFVGGNLKDYEITRTGGPVPDILTAYNRLSKNTFFKGMKKDKWNPADIWMYKKDTQVGSPKTLEELTQLCGPTPKGKNQIIGISLKKGGNRVYYRDPGRDDRVSGSLDTRPTGYKVKEFVDESMFLREGLGDSAEQCKYVFIGGGKTYKCQVRGGSSQDSFRLHFSIASDPEGAVREYAEGSLGGAAALRILDSYVHRLKGQQLSELQRLLEQEKLIEGKDPLSLHEGAGDKPIALFLQRIRLLYGVDPDKVKEYIGQVHRVAVADSLESCPFFICGK